MQKQHIIIAAIVIVVLGAALVYFSGNQNTVAGQGKVIVGITDAAALLQGVSSVMMTVDMVEVQSAARGWVTVASSSKQYDLLQLKQSGAVALLADANLPAGTYNQIRLTISKVLITVFGKTQEAKLPSGTLKIAGRLVVEDGKTATAVLDFMADKSFHVTGNGKFIMAPVVRFQTKSNASVEKKPDGTLKIDGGKEEDDKNVGMDEHGDTKEDFEIDDNAKIEIDSKDVIHITNRNVTIQNSSFNQKSITIKKGGTVVWTNKDSVAHTVTGNNGGPESPIISTNGTYSYTFNSAGTFGYHCAIHPSMTGTVVVTD